MKYKFIWLAVTLIAIPYSIYKIDYWRELHDKVVFVLPDEFEGVFGVIYSIKKGKKRNSYHEYRRYMIPNYGYLFTKFKKPDGKIVRRDLKAYCFESDFSKYNSNICTVKPNDSAQVRSELIDEYCICAEKFVIPLGRKRFINNDKRVYYGDFYSLVSGDTINRKINEKLIYKIINQ